MAGTRETKQLPSPCRNHAAVEEGRPPLDSVDRALHLLEALNDGRVSVKNAADLSVAPSTAHRLLNALRFRNFAI